MRTYQRTQTSTWRLFFSIYFLAVLIGLLWAAYDSRFFDSAPTPQKKPDPAPIRTVRPSTSQETLKQLEAIQAHMDRGELLSARDAASHIKAEQISSDPLRKEFLEQKARIGQYCDILKETRVGTLGATPQITLIATMANQSMPVTIRSEDAQSIVYETLDGQRGRSSKDQIRNRRNLTTAETQTLLEKEYRKRLDEARNPATAQKLFEVADFAARNGMNLKLIGLFQKILDMDPTLVKTIQDEKAHRLYLAFLYFSQVNNRDEAQATLHLIETQYPGSSWLSKITQEDRQPPQTQVAQKIPRKEPPPKEPPPKEPTPQKPPQDPEQKKPSPADDLMAKANGLFDEGMKHLLNSDPLANPESANKENSVALAKFDEAFKIYLQLQELENSDWLDERIRLTVSHRVMCRRRSIQ